MATPKQNIELEQITIGRGTDNKIVLTPQNISRNHAILTICGPTVYLIEDLDSKYGTFVNGERIKRKLIADEDKLTLATNDYQVQEILSVAIQSKNNKLKADPLDFTEEFAALKTIYEEFIEQKKSVKEKEKSVKKWAVIAASSLGVGALIASGGGIAPLMGIVSAAAATGTGGGITAAAILATLSSSGLGMLVPTMASNILSTEEKIEAFTRELKKVYRCPNCKRPFGTTDYEDLYIQKKCNSTCKAIWVK